jgi:hypothetical protein
MWLLMLIYLSLCCSCSSLASITCQEIRESVINSLDLVGCLAKLLQKDLAAML